MINIKDTFFLCKKLCYNIACLLRELEGSSGTLVNLATEYGSGVFVLKISILTGRKF